MSNESAHASKPGWFELFYDLIIVAAVSQAGKVFVKDPSWASAALILVSVLLLFTVWLLTSISNGLMSRDTTARRVTQLAQMLALIVAALALGKYGLPNYIGFAAGAVVFLSEAVLYAQYRRQADSNGRQARVIIVSTSITAGLLAIGALVSDRLDSAQATIIAPLLLALAVAVTVIPLMTRVIRALMPVLNREHLDERFGLLIIIVLGETFINLVGNLGMLGTIPSPEYFVAAFVLTYCLWWIYFSICGSAGLPASIAGMRIWIGAHALLMFGLIAVAASLTALTLHGYGDQKTQAIYGAWSPLPLLIALLALTVLSWTAPHLSSAIRLLNVIALALLAVLTACDLIFSGQDVGPWMLLSGAVVLGDAIACSVILRRR